MAIQKFTPSDMSEVLTLLQTYGVPTYFDNVTRSDQSAGDYVSCYIGDVEFIRIYASVSGNSAPDKNSTNHTGVFVTTANGAEQGFTLGYDSVFGNIEIDSITVCDSCIVITPTAQKQNFFIICKDNDDNTAVFTITTNSQGYWTGSTGIGSNTGTTYRLWAVSFADTFIRSYTITFDNADAISESYVCQPIATAQHTLRNVYLPAVRQFYEETEPFAAEIDGYAYLCGRGFVARDSAAVDTDTSAGLDTSSFYTAAQMDVKLSAMQAEINAAAEQAGAAKTAADALAPAVDYSKTLYVNASTGSDANDGSEALPFLTIEKAIAEARKHRACIISIAGGTYPTAAAFDIRGACALSIRGSGDAENPTIINGRFSVGRGAWLSLEKLTIAGEATTSNGSVFTWEGAKACITDCTLTPTGGYGINASTISTVYATGCTFEGTPAAIARTLAGSTVILRSCTDNTGVGALCQNVGNLELNGSATITYKTSSNCTGRVSVDNVQRYPVDLSTLTATTSE